MKHPLAQFIYCPECGSDQFTEHCATSKKCQPFVLISFFNPSAALFNDRSCNWGKDKKRKKERRETLPEELEKIKLIENRVEGKYCRLDKRSTLLLKGC